MFRTGLILLAVATIVWAQQPAAKTGPQTKTAVPKGRTFATPEEARDALVRATTAGTEQVRDIFGPASEKIVQTGDYTQDQLLLAQFRKRVAEKTRFEINPMNPNRATLLLGEEEWPFAVPLVRKDGRWFFDVVEGEAEIHRRIIGGNELDAIQVCHGYVEAQERYSLQDWNGDGLREYAKRITSSPGGKDGLYWPGADSPVAEAFAKAAAEGYTRGINAPKPYHGYLYKILTKQGPSAPGGERDYMVHSFFIGGYALVAWPVEYGTSGIKSFIVNQDGVVYEKDLGPRTTTLAPAIKEFNPDGTWEISPLVINTDE